MSAAEIISSIVQLVLVTGVAFVLLCALASYLRFQQMAKNAEGTAADDPEGRQAFSMQIASRIGTAHRDPAPFTAMLIRLDTAEFGGEASREELVAELRTAVRKRMRAKDVLLRVDDSTVGVVINVNRQVAGRIAERVVEAVQDISVRLADSSVARLVLRIGFASFPEAGERSAAILEAAGRAIEEAAKRESYVIVDAASDMGVDTDEPMGTVPRATPADPMAAIPASQHKLVDHDTGFLLFAHLDGVLQKTVAQHRRDQLPISLIMVEIDHLDRYRDHYGEPGVKAIYQHFGSLLQNAVRESDLLGRFEAERLLLILGCSPRKALVAAQRLSDDVKKMPIEFGGPSLKATISVGVAGFPDHGGVTRRLVEYAGLALEVAKAKGRNQCILYGRGLDIPREAMRLDEAY